MPQEWMDFHQVMQDVTDMLCREENCHPYDINNGRCDEWANEVAERLKANPVAEPLTIEIWETVFGFADTDHQFLRINGRFYDAEEIQGVAEPNQLPIFARLSTSRAASQPVWRIDHNGRYLSPSRYYLTAEEERDYCQENGLEPPAATDTY